MPVDLFQQAPGIPDVNASGQNAYHDTTGTAAPEEPLKLSAPSPQMVQTQQNTGIPVPPPLPPAPPPTGPANEEPGGRDLFAPSEQTTTAYGGVNRGYVSGQDVLDAQKNDQAQGSANMKSVSEAAGGPVDAAHGIDSFGTAADLAFSVNSAERVRKLQAMGLDAKVIKPANMTSPMVVWRKPGEEAWHPIRGTDMSMGDVGTAAAAAPAVATQVGLSLLPELRAASPLVRMVTQGLAGGGERLAEREIDRARGFNTQGAGGDAAEAAKTGGTNAIAEMFGSLLSKLGLGVQGEAKGLFKPTGPGQAATEAQTRLQDFDPGVKPLTMFQTGSPLMQAKGAQLAAVSPYVQDSVLTPQYQSIADMFRKGMGDLTGGASTANPSGLPAIETPELDKILQSMSGDAQGKLAAAVPSPEVEASQAGKTLQNALNTQVRPAITEKVNSRYGDILDPKYGGVFDLSGVNRTADEISAGIPAQGAPVTKTTETPISNGYGMGTPSVRTTEETTIPKVQIGGATADTQHVIDQLKKLNPTLGTETTTNTAATAPLQSVRSQLGYSAGEYPVGGTPAQKASYVQANKLLAPLDEAIANPVAGDEALGTKVAAAKNSAKFKSTVLDSNVMQDVKNSQSPEDLMKYTQPGNFTNLQLVKRVMPKEAFQSVQDAFKTQLTRQPDQIPNILKSYADDPRTLDMLLSKPEQKAFSDYSDMVGQVQKSLPAQMKAQTDMSARIGTMIDQGKGADIADMIARSEGGADGKVGSNIRAAYMQNVLDKATDTNTGQIDPQRMIKTLGGIIESGQAKGILKPAEMQRFMDARTYVSAANNLGSSMQSSLHVGTMANSGFDFLKPVNMAKTWGNVGLHAFQARMMTSPAASKFWIGAGQPAMASPRAITDGMGALLNEMRYQEPQPKADKPEGGSNDANTQ